MTMSDSQRYPEKLFLIKYDLDINAFNFKNWLFSRKVKGEVGWDDQGRIQEFVQGGADIFLSREAQHPLGHKYHWPKGVEPQMYPPPEYAFERTGNRKSWAKTHWILFD